MPSIDCIFCHTKEADCPVVITENGYDGRQCEACGLVFISPRPTPEEIANLYGHDQAHVSQSVHEGAKYSHVLHARVVLSLLKKFKKAGSILDIGAGVGDFLLEARRQGFDAHGLELNPGQASMINSLGIPCEVTSIEDAFPGKKFDIIYHCDVISHLYDPISDFRSMQAKLNDGGVIIFETGNFGDVEKKYYHHYEVFQYPDHLFFFSIKNLKQLLSMTGFRTVALHSYSIVPHLKVTQLLGRILKAVKKPKNEAAAPAAASSTASVVAPSTQAPAYREGRLKKLRTWLLHFIRYDVGRVAPKKGRPQTVLVVATKVSPAAR